MGNANILGAEPYGLRFNFNLPPSVGAGRYDRLGALEEYNGVNGALAWNPEIAAKCTVQNRMRRCVIPDTIADPAKPQNSVAYYLHPTDSTKKADGTAAKLDGTDGQVMVEIPRFFQKAVYSESSPDEMEWWISPSPKAGYTVHPAFFKIIDGKKTEVPFRYMSAYEGVLQLGDQYLDYYDYEGTPNAVHQRIATNERQLRYQAAPKLASVKGRLPVAQGTRAEFREAARNRDGNADDSTWRLTDWSLWSAIQLLFLVEYGTFNSQGALAGDNAGGLSNLTPARWAASVSGGSSAYLPIVPTGGTESLGNGSGNVPLKDIYGEGAGLPIFDGTNDLYWTDVIPCYRGIESPYGHIWQWLDGIVLDFNTVNRLDAYASPGAFLDDTPSAAYRKFIAHGEANNVPDSGYFARIHEAAGLDGFYPRASGGSTITGITDYYYNTSGAGKRVVAVGGLSAYGGRAGVFYVLAYYGSGSRDTYIGGRLCL